jgi:hypothetical protein
MVQAFYGGQGSATQNLGYAKREQDEAVTLTHAQAINQMHSGRRLVRRLLDENRGLQEAAIARRELQCELTSLREDMAAIRSAAEAGLLREVIDIVDDATARRERTREPRKGTKDE